jgi:hypothetical protein
MKRIAQRICNTVQTDGQMNTSFSFYSLSLLFMCLSFTVFLGYSQDTLTYPDLLERLYDLDYLATVPDKDEHSGNFSSYDRRSRYDEATNTYLHWDANDDGSGYIRKEGDGIVIFEKDGPGVIWRFWSALAKEGHINIFIDHSDSPVVDMPFRDFFEKFDEDIPPMNLPNLVMTLSRGRNRFLPIPYNKHCKIVLASNWGAYYHITYTTFSGTTRLPVYTGKFSRDECIAIAQADRLLGNRGYIKKTYKRESTEKKDLVIGAGQRVVIDEITGNKAITSLKFKYDSLSEFGHNVDFLKYIWLSITWDSDREPAVMAPIGMFFGTSPGSYPFRALPLGLIGDELYANWFMPFSEKAHLELMNKGNRSFTLKCSITLVQLNKSPDKYMQFHARWHDGSNEMRNSLKDSGRSIDWPLLKVIGKGRYCGLSLHVQNTWDEPEMASDEWWYGKWDRKTIDWWWGEGDEKFFVDGEKFPSTFGTGSEDYIGYAWSAEPPFPVFDSPFACQPFTPVNGNGHTIVSRFHIADNIPFQRSFEAYIEKYKKDQWGKNNTCLYDVVVYWYQLKQ